LAIGIRLFRRERSVVVQRTKGARSQESCGSRRANLSHAPSGLPAQGMHAATLSRPTLALTLLMMTLMAWAAPAYAQLSLVLTPASQTGGIGQTLTYNAALINNSGSSFTWDTFTYSADPSLTVNLNSAFDTGSLANGAYRTLNSLFTVTPSQLGFFTGTVFLNGVNGSGGSTTASATFQVHATPPPAGLMVVFTGGAMILLSSRLWRGNRTGKRGVSSIVCRPSSLRRKPAG
jgi:hypothetical protein